MSAKDKILILNYEKTLTFDYKQEFTGESDKIKTFLKLSQKVNKIIISRACITLNGKLYSSAVVCENGKLLAILDDTTAMISVVNTSIGKICVLVNEDCKNLAYIKLAKEHGAIAFVMLQKTKSAVLE